jgi:cation diffusion facilitator CzcD-associated flavoprotein CzcO
MHAARYRNPDEFRGVDVLVVGPGCSGMEIAYDLAEGGAGRVWISVRTQPNIMLRQSGGLPGDLPARASLRLPPRIADRGAALVRRMTIGDLSRWGLVPPEEGVFSRNNREGKAPAIVDKAVIRAIKAGKIEVVASVASLDQTGVVLGDGSRLEPGALIAATGYGSGLEPVVGHLGVLDERGFPCVHGGPAAAPGLRFIGYQPAPGQIGDMGREARRVAKEIEAELAASDAVPAEPQPAAAAAR